MVFWISVVKLFHKSKSSIRSLEVLMQKWVSLAYTFHMNENINIFLKIYPNKTSKFLILIDTERVIADKTLGYWMQLLWTPWPPGWQGWCTLLACLSCIQTRSSQDLLRRTDQNSEREKPILVNDAVERVRINTHNQILLFIMGYKLGLGKTS